MCLLRCNREQLGEAIKKAAELPFEVLDANGAAVVGCTANGPAVSLPPGSYRIRYPAGKETALKPVIIEARQTHMVELK